MPQYRVDFINRLRVKLAGYGVELSYVYGKSNNQDSLKKDEVELEWGNYVPNRTWRIKDNELVWQPCTSYLQDKDLVIVEQANRNLLNYYLILRKAFTNRKFAYWGHGRNMQAEEKGWRNAFKMLFLHACDWWFAYTGKVKDLLVQSDYPANQITCVQNAIDTRALSQQYDALTEEDAYALKLSLNIHSDNVVIYCGGIYKEKRILFLLEACNRIREQIKDLHLIVIGSGPDVDLIRQATQTRDWIHYIGPVFGLERVKYFKISTLTLIPGLVGLGILDSFATQTPVVTTNFPFHSPEIEYLENGVNGIMTEDHLDFYVKAVVETLQNPLKRETLKRGCRKAAQVYTVDQMVENFSTGVLQALGCAEVKQQQQETQLQL